MCLSGSYLLREGASGTVLLVLLPRRQLKNWCSKSGADSCRRFGETTVGLGALSSDHCDQVCERGQFCIIIKLSGRFRRVYEWDWDTRLVVVVVVAVVALASAHHLFCCPPLPPTPATLARSGGLFHRVFPASCPLLFRPHSLFYAYIPLGARCCWDLAARLLIVFALDSDGGESGRLVA